MSLYTFEFSQKTWDKCNQTHGSDAGRIATVMSLVQESVQQAIRSRPEFKTSLLKSELLTPEIEF